MVQLLNQMFSSSKVWKKMFSSQKFAKNTEILVEIRVASKLKFVSLQNISVLQNGPRRAVESPIGRVNLVNGYRIRTDGANHEGIFALIGIAIETRLGLIPHNVRLGIGRNCCSVGHFNGFHGLGPRVGKFAEGNTTHGQHYKIQGLRLGRTTFVFFVKFFEYLQSSSPFIFVGADGLG